MDLQDFKRWHWMLIGLLVGGLCAATRISYGPDIDAKNTWDDFEHALLATKDNPVPYRNDDGNTCILDIQVHPPVDDPTPDARAASTTQPAAKIQWITGTASHDHLIRDPKMWFIVKGHDIKVRPFIFKASVPYAPQHRLDDFVATKNVIAAQPFYRLPPTVAGYVRPDIKTYPSITQYFDELNRRYGAGTVKYRYRWWESSAAVMTLYPATGFVLIGVVWPTLLALLTGAGLGTKPKKEEIDLARYKATPTATAKGPTVTDQDREQLAAMSAELEKNLQATATASATATATVAATAIRQLDGSTPEPARATTETTKAAKTFGAEGGAFYPTEIHAKPKD